MLQQLRLNETQVVIVVILSVINRRLLWTLNWVQLLQHLQQLPANQHLMEALVLELYEKQALITSLVELKRLLVAVECRSQC